MKTRFYLFPLVALAITACGGQAEEQTKKETNVYNELKKASWFLGSWENNFPEGSSTESWKQVNDSTFTGESFVVIGTETVSSETLRLEERNGKLMYIPTVSDQNGGKEVVFTMTKNTGNMLVFENPKHDFPQKISYTKISGDSIVAEISGMMDGKAASQQFPMSRKK